MTIKVGEMLPQATFRVMTADGPAAKTTEDVFANRTVVLFGVPGAFTPTCHRNHLPGFWARPPRSRPRASTRSQLFRSTTCS